VSDYNASHYSARYAERKRAAQRAADLNPPPRPCNRCPSVSAPGSIFCAGHAAEYAELVRGGDVEACARFCRRTYWGEVSP
jgi:hypothetical protein